MEINLSTIEDNARWLGRAVKARREALGLALRALASMSGISPSMISDIERGTKSPTVATLSSLAKALGIPTSALLDMERSGPGRIHVVRGSKRRAAAESGGGARLESFVPAIAGTNVEFLRYAVPPHTVAGPFAAHASGTIEHIHLAAGAVRIVCGDDMVALEAGDSCSCFADAPHLFDNKAGKGEALIYLVIERGSGKAPRAARSLRRAARRRDSARP
jgi:transcriptional regulator with XRE-family HTH domain